MTALVSGRHAVVAVVTLLSGFQYELAAATKCTVNQNSTVM